METRISCPLGSQCEETRDGVRHRCAWFIQVRGHHPQTGALLDEWGCAMGWIPILLIESAQVGRGHTAALESFRNEVANGQGQILQIAAAAARRRLGGT